jgi:hypothetical protein
MEFGRVIPEAEEALEHSLMMPPALDSRFSPLQLKQMARDVDGLINRLPYHRAHLPPPPPRPPPTAVCRKPPLESTTRWDSSTATSRLSSSCRWTSPPSERAAKLNR